MLSVPESKVNVIQRYFVEPALTAELGKSNPAEFRVANVVKLPEISVGLVVQVDSVPILAEVMFSLPARSGLLGTVSVEARLTSAISIDPPLCRDTKPETLSPGANGVVPSPKEAATELAGVDSLLSSNKRDNVPDAKTFPVLVAVLLKNAYVAPPTKDAVARIEITLAIIREFIFLTPFLPQKTRHLGRFISTFRQ